MINVTHRVSSPSEPARVFVVRVTFRTLTSLMLLVIKLLPSAHPGRTYLEQECRERRERVLLTLVPSKNRRLANWTELSLSLILLWVIVSAVDGQGGLPGPSNALRLLLGV